jgi:hypothetical protein
MAGLLAEPHMTSRLFSPAAREQAQNNSDASTRVNSFFTGSGSNVNVENIILMTFDDVGDAQFLAYFNDVGLVPG